MNMEIKALDSAVNDNIFRKKRGANFPVKLLEVGQTGFFSWDEYSKTHENASHDSFIKAVRQACYRAKPMRFRVARYDDYAFGVVAVERLV